MEFYLHCPLCVNDQLFNQKQEQFYFTSFLPLQRIVHSGEGIDSTGDFLPGRLRRPTSFQSRRYVVIAFQYIKPFLWLRVLETCGGVCRKQSVKFRSILQPLHLPIITWDINITCYSPSCFSRSSKVHGLRMCVH